MGTSDFFFFLRDVYLVQLQGHLESWGNDFVQQVNVCKHPFISGCNSEVTFEEGVEAIQEGVQAVKQKSSDCWFTGSEVIQHLVTQSRLGSPVCHLKKHLNVSRLSQQVFHQTPDPAAPLLHPPS